MVKYKYKGIILMLTMLFFGVTFRLWFINLNPLPIKFDQEEYYHMAESILSSFWHNFTYRLYGHPIFIASIYKLAGNDNHLAWKVAQSILDSLTGVLIYLIGKKILKKELPSAIGSFFYLINPYTSAFVGVMLTEVLATFLLTFVSYLFLVGWERKNIFCYLTLSLTLGFIPQVRPGFWLYTMAFLFVAMYLLIKLKLEHSISASHLNPKIKKSNILSTLFLSIFSICLYFLPFSYNLFLNTRNFNQVSLLTADNLFVREFYVSLFVIKDSPKLSYTPEVNWMYHEYSAVNTYEERAAMAKKHFARGIEYIKSDPQKFLFSRLAKLWYVWEKPYIFAYSYLDSWESVGYWLNVLILLLGMVGFFLYYRSEIQRKIQDKAMVLLFILLIVYTTAIHIFSVTDGRFSLPAYPLIFMFMGFGIYRISGLKQLFMFLSK